MCISVCVTRIEWLARGGGSRKKKRKKGECSKGSSVGGSRAPSRARERAPVQHREMNCARRTSWREETSVGRGALVEGGSMRGPGQIALPHGSRSQLLC